MFLIGTYVLNIIDANVGAIYYNLMSARIYHLNYIENHYFDFSQSAGINLKLI